MNNVLMRTEDQDSEIQRKNHVNTQGEGGHLRENSENVNPADTLILDFKLPELRKNKFVFLAIKSVVLSYGKPNTLMQCANPGVQWKLLNGPDRAS